MKKSIFVVIFVLAAGAAAVVALSGTKRGDSRASVIAGLDALSNEKAEAVGVPEKKLDFEIPVISKTGPWPKVVAEELTFAFGRMQIKELNSHPFRIRNDGEASLILQAGSTTCKCTQFDFDPSDEVSVKYKVLKPGESVVLTMSWKAGELPDRSFRHGGDVYTNDPAQPTLKFAVEGAIEMPYEILPQTWNVGDIFDGQSGKFQGAIASRIYDNLEIESIGSPSGMVAVNSVPMTPEQRGKDHYSSGFVLNVEIPDSIPSGIFREELEIKLSGLMDPIKVSVMARKHGVIRIQQMGGMGFNADKMRVQMGSFAASEGREGKLLVIVDQKGMTEPLKIIKSESDPSFLTATLTPLGEPTGTVHRYILTLTAPANRPHAQRTESNPGFLRLSTNHPSGENLNFDVLLYSN